ncbi:hypothetical protein ACKWTF_011571 [Chironomus riparius]
MILKLFEQFSNYFENIKQMEMFKFLIYLISRLMSHKTLKLSSFSRTIKFYFKHIYLLYPEGLSTTANYHNHCLIIHSLISIFISTLKNTKNIVLFLTKLNEI